MMTPTAIAQALTTMLADESTFARAEALYGESFRGGPAFTVADGIYARADLLQYLMSPIYRPAEVSSDEAVSFLTDDDFECLNDFDCHDDHEPEILKPGLSQEDAEKLVDHLQFIELCNYKGEGEGFELTCRVGHLREFVGKYEYLDASASCRGRL